ncbi:MAG TPA: 2-dehydro-3-deoxy-D-gluconate 5-dehydrogenase KduD [Negativicutes bacterium]|nr:2-dehydro-3-deoxy-D-gluconate 5-dehydrogenase KduD [Negativicutes bacterium]
MILDKLNLSGRVAIVTGASRGLGAGMAIGLAEAGADLVVVASSTRLQETVEKIKALGRRCIGVQVDLIDTKVIPKIIDAALKEYGRIDILINCAGIIRRAPAIEFSEKDWDDVVQINQKATFFMCQAVAKEMVKQKKGKIINIASLLSFQGGIIVPSYTASKSAVAGLTKALANEWAPLGINVNAIAPGYMATEMTEALQKSNERAPAILARIPAGRWGTPEDMKGLAVFLASDAAEYVQGQVIAVDGGWLGR